MAITQFVSDERIAPLATAFGAFQRPANVVLALGVVLFVAGALVLRVGVWAAIIGVWGLALFALGVSIRAVVWWIRR